MKVATASLICASALISVNADSSEYIAKKNDKDVCGEICKRQLSGSKFRANVFSALQSSCPMFVESGDTSSNVVSICEKVKAHFKDDNTADSGTLNTGGTGNTLNTGGTGNTVNQPETPAEDKKSSTHVATVSMMTTLTILGLNFL